MQGCRIKTPPTVKALLINNKEIQLNGVTYQACPELEEFQEYTLISEIENTVHPNHPSLYEIEESDRWLLKTRFVPMEGETIEVAAPMEHTSDAMRYFLKTL